MDVTTLHGEKDGVNNTMDIKIGNSPGFPRWTQSNQKIPHIQRLFSGWQKGHLVERKIREIARGRRITYAIHKKGIDRQGVPQIKISSKWYVLRKRKPGKSFWKNWSLR